MEPTTYPTLQQEITRQVREALAEDLVETDWSAQILPNLPYTKAHITVKQSEAVLCGIAWAEACFKALDGEVRMTWYNTEGDILKAGSVICDIIGRTHALLSAERTALNFLQTLSSTATQTQRYVQAIAGISPNPHGCHILDSRKTLPGLRQAQKYAVKIGGGNNQRLTLGHGILIKENHISACGNIENALVLAHRLAQKNSPAIPVQIEVESLDELQQALNYGASSILLDNFSIENTYKAVAQNQKHKQPALLETSGNITLNNIRSYAATGVNRISIGEITKNINAIDFSMCRVP